MTGNELDDKLEKGTSSKIEITLNYNREQKSVKKRVLELKSRETWQMELETTKKDYHKRILPDCSGGIKNENNLTQHLTTLVTATATYNHIYTGLGS